MYTPFKNHSRPLSRFSSRRLPALFASGLGIILMLICVGAFSGTQTHAQTLSRKVAEQHIVREHHTTLQQLGSFTKPDPIESLSPDLSAYLTGLGTQAGVVVYDVTHQHTYVYNGDTSFLTASSIKVPIMLAFFARTESQGREPNGDEIKLLTAMIEHSDNDAASALFNDIGRAAGLASYLHQIGVGDLVPNDNAWGYSQITPQAMVRLLTQLHYGTILTAPDRATALYLMQHVEAGQQWGVGNTAPSGATFAMKNGWVPGPDGLWSVNTSGIVEADGVTYLIAVYTQRQPSLAAGQAIVQQVCRSVAASLV